MAKVMQMLHEVYKGRGNKLVTREDMLDALDSTLDFDGMTPEQLARTIIHLDRDSIRSQRDSRQRKNRNTLNRVLNQY